MICSYCNEEILTTDKVAHGSYGTIHYKCFKRGTSVGKEISLFSISEEIGKLKKRIQDLERTVKIHDASIDFKIG